MTTEVFSADTKSAEHGSDTLVVVCDVWFVYDLFLFIPQNPSTGLPHPHQPVSSESHSRMSALSLATLLKLVI